jgi:hypothetical protein
MKNKIQDLRNHLFATLEALQDEDTPMDVDRAKAIAAISGKIIDTAKVEVAFIKELKLDQGTGFIDDPKYNQKSLN